MAKSKAQYKKEYKKLEPIYSQALDVTVRFNSRGFQHITHGRRPKARKASEQFLKLRYMSVYREVIEKCEEVVKTQERDVKINRKSKVGIFYELRHSTKMGVVSIIIRRIKGSDKYYFWSVVPRRNKRRKNKKRPR